MRNNTDTELAKYSCSIYAYHLDCFMMSSGLGQNPFEVMEIIGMMHK